MIHLRASSLHLARACPPSQSPVLRVEGDKAAADMGSAVHHLTLIRIGHGQEMDIPSVARMFNVDSEELERLAAQTWRAWEKVRGHFPEPKIEEYLKWTGLTFREGHEVEFEFSGHIDILSRNVGAFIDLKSGWGDVDHTDQMKSYAWLLLQERSELESVYGLVISPRLGHCDGEIYWRHDLDLWWEGLMKAYFENQETYSPGPHCIHCPRGAECPAKAALLRQAMFALNAYSVYSLDQRDGPALAKLLDQTKLMEATCERLRDMIKAEVSAQGGRVATGDGRELVIKEEERERIRLNTRARHIFGNILTDEEWQKTVKASKTELKKAVMSHYPLGQKGKAWDAILEELRIVDSVEKTIITKLEVKRDVRTISSPGSSDHGGA